MILIKHGIILFQDSVTMKLAWKNANGIIAGDVAVGSQKFLNFIRGNIGIRIRDVNGNSVVEMAKEIDEQIIRHLKDMEL